MRLRGAAKRAATIAAVLLCAAHARAEAPDPCAVPGYLLFGDGHLEHVSAAVKRDKQLKVAVIGGGSSTLPGPAGPSFAYPARLEAALSGRLPGTNVKVEAITKPRQTAEQMSDQLDTLLDQKPTLVIWQTGTYDAVRGTDPEEFRAAISEGVDRLQKAGIDVILMNMQYSPRTDAIVAAAAYADAIRWVAREREVPVYDRLAIMRHWYDAGQFDLYAATRDMKTAKSVHDCIGRTLATSIIDAAHLPAHEGKAPQ